MFYKGQCIQRFRKSRVKLCLLQDLSKNFNLVHLSIQKRNGTRTDRGSSDRRKASMFDLRNRHQLPQVPDQIPNTTKPMQHKGECDAELGRKFSCQRPCAKGCCHARRS